MGPFDVKLSPHEQSLIERVECRLGADDLAGLTAEELQTMGHRDGIDFATVLLYEYVRKSMIHGDFIRRVESQPRICDRSLDLGARLVIVPGAFYREFPQSGADGRLLQQTARDLGMPIDVIPVNSFGLPAENAAIVSDWLQRHDEEPIVLVSLSKGSLDLKTALARPDAARLFRRVKAWISLSGIIFGTPIVRWVLSSSLRAWWYRFLLSLRGYDFRVVHELNYGARAPLISEMRLPQHMQLIHVIGFSLECHLSSLLARRAYRRIQHLGPNDGGGILLADVLRLPGMIFFVWGADHYLRPSGRDMQHLMRSILHSLSGLPTATECQAVGSGAET